MAERIQDVDMSAETPDHYRRFSPEQRQGLEAVGFTFAVNVQALSLDQLSQDPSARDLFAYITGIVELRSITPVARQVAVNPRSPYVLGSQGLSYDDQLELVEIEARKLRSTCLKVGTLEGVDFGPERASVLSQLDFEHQRRFKGTKLFPDYFVRSNDEYDHPRFGPLVPGVGRHRPGDPLAVLVWERGHRPPFLGLSFVATPAGNR